MNASRKSLGFAAVLALGFALRLEGLDRHSIWIDEAGTLCVANADDVVAALRADRHPPLSFLLFRGWMALVGESDALLRLLPALASCASLVLTSRLARAKLDVGAALLATAIAAIAPLEIWMAQEVRMYAFVELFALAAFTCASAWLARPRWTLLAGVLIACAAATGFHYFGAFSACSVAVLAWIACARGDATRSKAMSLTIAAGIGAAAWIPWLALVLRDQLADTAGFQARSGIRAVLVMPARLVLPDAEWVTDTWRGVLVWTAVVLSVGLASCAWLALHRRDKGAIDALALLGVPPACALLAALVGPLNFIARYFATSIPGAHLAIAHGFTGLRARAARGALIVLALSGLAALTIVGKLGNAREDWRGASADVARAWRPGDRVISLTHLADAYSEAPLRHYLRERREVLAALVRRSELSNWNSSTLAPGARIHVVYRDTPYSMQACQDLCRRFRVAERESLGHHIERLVLE